MLPFPHSQPSTPTCSGRYTEHICKKLYCCQVNESFQQTSSHYLHMHYLSYFISIIFVCEMYSSNSVFSILHFVVVRLPLDARNRLRAHISEIFPHKFQAPIATFQCLPRDSWMCRSLSPERSIKLYNASISSVSGSLVSSNA